MSTTPNTVKGQLTLTNVRLSFPDLFTPKSIGGGKPRYGASFLLDKKSDKGQLDAINKIIKQLTDEEFGGKPLAPDKLPIHDGDFKDYDGYAGNYYLSAAKGAEIGRVDVKDNTKDPLTNKWIDLGPTDGKPYAGCLVNAVVRFYALNGKSTKKPNDFGKRICCSLEVVQFSKDGEPFGAPRVDAEATLPGESEDPDFT